MRRDRRWRFAVPVRGQFRNGRGTAYSDSGRWPRGTRKHRQRIRGMGSLRPGIGTWHQPCAGLARRGQRGLRTRGRYPADERRRRRWVRQRARRRAAWPLHSPDEYGRRSRMDGEPEAPYRCPVIANEGTSHHVRGFGPSLVTWCEAPRDVVANFDVEPGGRDVVAGWRRSTSSTAPLSRIVIDLIAACACVWWSLSSRYLRHAARRRREMGMQDASPRGSSNEPMPRS
jgi:hypothetical protein